MIVEEYEEEGYSCDECSDDEKYFPDSEGNSEDEIWLDVIQTDQQLINDLYNLESPKNNQTQSEQESSIKTEEDTIFSMPVINPHNINKEKNIVKFTFGDQKMLSFEVKIKHFSLICSAKRGEMVKEHIDALDSAISMDKYLLTHFASIAALGQNHNLDNLQQIEINTKIYSLEDIDLASRTLCLQNILYDNMFYQDSYLSNPILNEDHLWKLLGEDNSPVN